MPGPQPALRHIDRQGGVVERPLILQYLRANLGTATVATAFADWFCFQFPLFEMNRWPVVSLRTLHDKLHQVARSCVLFELLKLSYKSISRYCFVVRSAQKLDFL